MALSFVDAAPNTGSGTSVSITKPSGKWTNGNLLIGANEVIDTGATKPASYTALKTGGNCPSEVCDRVASSEPASVSFGITGGGVGNAFVLEYTGQDPTTPINASGTPTGGSPLVSSVNANFPSITTTVDGCIILAILAANAYSGSISYTDPASFTRRTSKFQFATNGYSIAAWDFTQTTKGAITPGNVTISAPGAGEIDWDAYTFAIAPAAASTPQLSANITLGALQLSATLKAIDKLSASINLGALTASQVLKAIDKLQASIGLGALIQNATFAEIAKLQSSVSLAALLQSATFHNTAGPPVINATMLPLYRRRRR